ncbi:MAG: phosphate ABC transporter permease subunit PstC [Acutalibacteraceae bacterium]|nr:phosphate ABC transporter permease subunit PstC [Acutalibacteraceae bacterium]
MQAVFLVCAFISIAAVIMICYFVFVNGFPAFHKIGPANFLFGRTWNPDADQYGIFPMIIASLYVTAGAIIIGVPIGIFTAVYLSCYANKKIHDTIEPAVQLLAGIPSIVYGFFGLVVIVPILQAWNHNSGKGILTASILLGLMILPTIITTTESSLNAVPSMYYEGSLALGATKERSIFRATFPAARSGILSGVILGIGRAIGETMAVIMVCGNQTIMPESITSGVRTMTSNIVLEMGYASGLHREALITTSAVLFVFILIINLCFSAVNRKKAA